MKREICLLLMLVCLMAVVANSQTTAFTYQGKLTDGVNAATGTYQMQFSLYDAETAGTQIGATITNNSVQIANGIFNVSLDFTAPNAFDGSPRWLEIGIRKTTDPPGFTVLTPRQLLTSAPYSIRSLNANVADNALKLNSVPASDYIVTTDTRLTDARTPTPGSVNYIQNGVSLQTTSSFNISGTGSGNIFNAATQYNIGGNRVLSVDGELNTFVGIDAGTSNTGIYNSTFGNRSGTALTNGSFNAFFGTTAGVSTTTGSTNAFFGEAAGYFNTTGSDNTFIGSGAGRFSSTGIGNTAVGRETGSGRAGNFNTFLGMSAGGGNSTGSQNSYFGRFAGAGSTSGNNNSFFGSAGGDGNQTGSYNSALGYGTRFNASNLNYAAAIGSYAAVATDDTIVIGKIAGTYLDPATNTNVPRPADTVVIPGNTNISGALTIGGGTPLIKSLNNTATLNFPVTGNNAISDLTITVSGAIDGDAIFLGVPNANITALTSYTAWVSAPDTVTVRFTNQTGAPFDPASGTFRVVIMR